MSKRDLVLVLGVTAIALVPGAGVYTYLEQHPLPGTGGTSGELAAAVTAPRGAAGTVVYQSQPEKVVGQYCNNSYYMSFTLQVVTNRSVVLTKRCESRRDVSGVWRGTIAATTTEEGGPERQAIVLALGSEGDVPQSATIVLTAGDDRLEVQHTDFAEMSTTTVFERLPGSVEEGATPAVP